MRPATTARQEAESPSKMNGEGSRAAAETDEGEEKADWFSSAHPRMLHRGL